jgi:hypothetical protein
MDRYTTDRLRNSAARAAECAAIAMKATDSRIKAFSTAQADTWLRLAAKIAETCGQGSASTI